ncbi:carboxylic ester hydrolase-like [Diabrotica undecimpunctata]|uniref:carboxylic ester hydrolase-like n=1 Tax=Diabrotica undecimpunctata TaxID=50387 RepID=UPI003B632525
MHLKIVVVLLQLVFVVFADDDGTIVTISNGKIQGKTKKSLDEQKYYAFEGIPYAAPPTGDNRFKAPQKVDDWDGTLATKRNEKACLQIIAVIPQGSEDCLYLNVYTPADLKSSNSQSLPVLVWFQGSAYQSGSTADVKPVYFMDYDVILVTVNYRLGVFGFLSTGDDVASGNWGLKDQRFALQWVRKNIDQFGGDPNKVTIGGQNAGASSVGFHMLANTRRRIKKGLFRSVISESGSALCPQYFQSDPKKYADELATLIDSSFKGDSEDLLALLRKQTPEKLTRLANAIKLRHLPVNDPIQSIFIFNIWLPVIEDGDSDSALIYRPMHKDFMDGKFSDIPMLIGYNSEEAIYYPDYVAALNFASRIDNNPQTLVFDNLNVEDKTQAGKDLRAIYTSSFKDNKGLLLEFFSDNLYSTPIIRQAELVSKKSPVYLYEFAYRGSNKALRFEDADNVAHTFELRYLFGDKKFNRQNDKLVHERMMKMWTNFVKYMNPTPDDDDDLIKWPKVKSSNMEYLIINSTLEISSQPKRYKKWKSVLGEHLSSPYWVY